jgi:glucose/mannose-6-phosphate isomerase
MPAPQPESSRHGVASLPEPHPPGTAPVSEPAFELGSLVALPDAVAAAALAARTGALGRTPAGSALPGHLQPDAVLIGGASGARHAAAGVAAIAAPHARVPVVVAGAELPAWVGPHSVFLALGAMTPLAGWPALAEAAGARGAQVWRVDPGDLSAAPRLDVSGDLALAQRRPLARLAAGAGVGGDLAQRRLFAPLAAGALAALAAAGVLPGEEVERWTDAAVAQLSARLCELGTPGAGAAGELASRLRRAVPLAMGCEGIGAVAARRLRSAINQAAKSPAISASYPGAITEELCGFGQLGDVTRQLLVLVEVRSDHELPGAGSWFAAGRPLLEEVLAGSTVLRAAGEGPLAQLLDLVLVVDAAAALVAAAEGVDPLPLPAAESVLGG